MAVSTPLWLPSAKTILGSYPCDSGFDSRLRNQQSAGNSKTVIKTVVAACRYK